MNNEKRVSDIIEARRTVYGDRSDIRRDRLLRQSASVKAESGRVLVSAKSRADSIPLGQPILVGHHSEGRDRNFRAKIHSDMGKAYALEDKARELLNQARAVGRAIASDDPEALTKLQAKLKAAKESHAIMIAANKAIRTHKGDNAAAIAAIVKTTGMLEENARVLLRPDFGDGMGFASYALANSKAEIFRIERRIKEIEDAMQGVDVERVLASGVTYREDVALNRVMLIFGYKPDSAARDILKGRGFRWAPSNEAWQRQLNNAGRYAAQCVVESLGLDPVDISKDAK